MSDDRTKDKRPQNTVSRILKEREKREHLEALGVENEQEYKKALNSMGKSRNGALVLRTLIKVCGVFEPDDGFDAAALIRKGERRNVYLKFIRPYLEPSIKQELES